jgi:hypothetical protein
MLEQRALLKLKRRSPGTVAMQEATKGATTKTRTRSMRSNCWATQPPRVEQQQRQQRRYIQPQAQQEQQRTQ